MSDLIQATGPHRATTPSDEDPAYLRERAKRLRDVAGGVYDLKALEELERFIVMLEARADQLAS